MMAWAAMMPQPVMASSCAMAGSTGACGLVPACGPVVPSASVPQAAGIWLISSPIVPVSCPACRFRASMSSSRIRAWMLWWSSRRPSSARVSSARLARALPMARSARTRGLRWPAISASIIARAVSVSRVDSTAEILIRARSSSFSRRARYRDLSCTSAARSRVSSRSRRISYGGMNDGCSRPFPVSLASHTASFLPVLARPGAFLTARALTSCTFSPAASRITNQIRQ